MHAPAQLHRPTCLLARALPTRAAYTMAGFAGVLLVGLARAKAKAEAHEGVTFTPMLIGALWGGG